VLGFAHTVGEFGVVLMIGGNIPGQTRVLSVALYDHVEASEFAAAHRLAAGMVVFALVVLVTLYVVNRPRNMPRRAPGAARSKQALLSLPRPGLHARRGRCTCPGRRDRAVRPFGLRQDHGAARLAGLERAAGRVALGAAVWQDDAQAASCPRTSGHRLCDPGSGAVPAPGRAGNLAYGRQRIAAAAAALRWTRWSTCWASAPAAAPARPRCRAASASAWPSPAPWPPARACC
jgi:hypothetical protein